MQYPRVEVLQVRVEVYDQGGEQDGWGAGQ